MWVTLFQRSKCKIQVQVDAKEDILPRVHSFNATAGELFDDRMVMTPRPLREDLVHDAAGNPYRARAALYTEAGLIVFCVALHCPNKIRLRPIGANR